MSMSSYQCIFNGPFWEKEKGESKGTPLEPRQGRSPAPPFPNSSLDFALDVFDVLDPAAGLFIHDIRPLPAPPGGGACRDHVHADLSTLRLRMGPNIVHSECQALLGLGNALLL